MNEGRTSREMEVWRECPQELKCGLIWVSVGYVGSSSIVLTCAKVIVRHFSRYRHDLKNIYFAYRAVSFAKTKSRELERVCVRVCEKGYGGCVSCWFNLYGRNFVVN